MKIKSILKSICPVRLFLILPGLVFYSLLPSDISAQTKEPQPGAPTAAEIKVEAPSVIAVEFYADWCMACKDLMPRLAEVKKSFEGQPILVVRFDLTNDITK